MFGLRHALGHNVVLKKRFEAGATYTSVTSNIANCDSLYHQDLRLHDGYCIKLLDKAAKRASKIRHLVTMQFWGRCLNRFSIMARHFVKRAPIGVIVA